MNHRAHRIGGACTGIVVATQIYQAELSDLSSLTKGTAMAIGFVVSGAALGSLLPDLDHPNSRIGRRLPSLSKITYNAFGHRGFTHTLFALILFVTGLFFLGKIIPNEFMLLYPSLVIGLASGYASHLLLDALTMSGIPLLYPIVKRPFRLAKMRSGIHDPLVSVLIVGATAIYIYFFSLKIII